MISHSYDYLIAFEATAVDIVTSQGHQPNVPTTTQSRIIHIYWASYDVNRRFVTSEWEYFIKPEGFIYLSIDAINQTKLANDDIQSKGVPLKDAISHFNEVMYRNYIHNNLSFCLVTKDDNVMTRILPSDSKESGIKLPNHFFNYFDIREEFRRLYKLPQTYNTVHDCLRVMQMRESPGNNITQLEIKNMLALIDRLVRDGHLFQTPKCLNTQHQIISENVELYDPFAPRPQQNTQQEPLPQNIRRESPPQNIERNIEDGDKEDNTRYWYARMRGIPFTAREREVMNFLKETVLTLEDVTIGYGSDGRPSGDAYIRFKSEDDFRAALSLSMSNMGSRYVEIFEASENDYNRARGPSQSSSKSKNGQGSNTPYSHLLDEKYGVLRMRGLPFAASDSDVVYFFEGYNLVKDGVKRGMTGGRPSGEGYAVFTSKDEAHRAMERNMEKLGSRFIELFSSSIRELEVFLNKNFGNNQNSGNSRDSGNSRNSGDNQGTSYNRENTSDVPYEKRKRTLSIMGLPFNVSKNEIVKFFDEYDLRESDINLIWSKGRFSGKATVTFADERDAQQALRTKNREYIGNRYIELFEYR